MKGYKHKKVKFGGFYDPECTDDIVEAMNKKKIMVDDIL